MLIVLNIVVKLKWFKTNLTLNNLKLNWNTLRLKQLLTIVLRHWKVRWVSPSVVVIAVMPLLKVGTWIMELYLKIKNKVTKHHGSRTSKAL